MHIYDHVFVVSLRTRGHIHTLYLGYVNAQINDTASFPNLFVISKIHAIQTMSVSFEVLQIN